MAFPTRGQVYALYLQICDDPGAAVFTDTPNVSTGAVSVFQSGFSQAYDLLFNNALNQQIPLVEEVIQGLTVGPSPIPFSVTPAQLGISSLGDWEWISERQFGSNDKFIDLIDRDRLSQREPTDRLIETVWQNGAWQFVGCTTVRELQLKYAFSSSGAPTNNATAVVFDGSLNFLANYAAGVTAGQKGYDAIANRCRSFAVGPKMDQGSIGGELFRLIQLLVRSRQNVKVAPFPYTTQRNRGWYRAVPYVSSMAGTTGGGAQNVPQQYSSGQGTVVGAIDGTNATFFVIVGLIGIQSVTVNGLLQTANVDFLATNNQIVFQPASIPQPGSSIVVMAFPAYQN